MNYLKKITTSLLLASTFLVFLPGCGGSSSNNMDLLLLLLWARSRGLTGQTFGAPAGGANDAGDLRIGSVPGSTQKNGVSNAQSCMVDLVCLGQEDFPGVSAQDMPARCAGLNGTVQAATCNPGP